MKACILFLATIFSFFFNSLNAQQQFDTLNGNSVSAIVSDKGRLFNNHNISSAGYEVPVGSGNHLIYSSGLWFGGKNQNEDLKLAVYGIGKSDFHIGPYSITNSYSDMDYINTYSSVVWNVKKEDVIHHISNYNQQGYVAPDGILNWPGNGDVSIGVAEQLASYVDVNNNGIYEPYLGDYPCIKGDQASYQIMHEDLPHDKSGGEKIGAEIHIMLYHFESSDYIDSTTFVEVKVFNRGENSFKDFKATVLMDPDIGFSEDDYIGSSPSKNLVYAYNGDNFDEGESGAEGYGINPPTLGIVSLNKDFEYSWFYNRSSQPSPIEYWYTMNGKRSDGSYWTNGSNTIPVQHIYDGNPNQGTGWTELNIDGNGTANPFGDRRFVATTIEETFLPGDVLIYNYGIITNRDGDHLQNVDGLINTANSVKQFFDSTNTYCDPNISLGLSDELEIGKLEISPNPASDQINIVWEGMKVNKIKITSYDGSLVKSIIINSLNGDKTIDINGLSSGVYFVNIGSVTKRLIVK